jgi:Putative beta-barrel porin 2
MTTDKPLALADSLTKVTPRGRRRSCAGVVALATLLVLGATPLFAQTDVPDDARVLYESLALSPVIRFTDVGWDDNVLRVNKADNPTHDLTATFSPGIQAWLRLPGVKVSGRSQVDFVYFKELSEFRSVDTDNGGRVELLFGRFTPYVDGTWTNTRHRRNFEIDDPVRRIESMWNAGVDVRLTGKTSVGVLARRADVDYTGNTVYLDNDLSQYLGAVARAEGVRIRFEATPFTKLGVDVEQYRNRLPEAPERNADGNEVAFVVESQPLAQVSGSARVGVTRRTFVDGSFPPFEGLVAQVDLGYTLLGRTRFAVGIKRDLSYSYRADQRDYLETSIRLTVTERIASAWDVGGSVGRFSLSYGLGESPPGVAGETPAEAGMGYSVEIGYQVGNSRIGFQVARQTRSSDFSVGRDYEQTRITSGVAYRF